MMLFPVRHALALTCLSLNIIINNNNTQSRHHSAVSFIVTVTWWWWWWWWRWWRSWSHHDHDQDHEQRQLSLSLSISFFTFSPYLSISCLLSRHFFFSLPISSTLISLYLSSPWWQLVLWCVTCCRIRVCAASCTCVPRVLCAVSRLPLPCPIASCVCGSVVCLQCW